MLTTKVKKDFQEWIIKKDQFHILLGELCFKAGASVSWKLIPVEMQFGVYQDYFWQEHSLWIYAYPEIAMDKSIYYIARVRTLLKGEIILELLFECDDNKTEDEARKTAIQEASKLLEDRI